MSDRITSAFGAYTDRARGRRRHDLNGVSAIVTGGASGIGVETARALAEAGAEVMLAVRNKEAGEATAARHRDDRARQGLGGDPVDLSDLTTVAALRQRLGRQAAGHPDQQRRGHGLPADATRPQDLEMQVGTNHFGHYLLSVLLARALMNAAQDGKRSRLVSLSSIGHRRGGVNLDDIHYRTRPYDKWESYGQAEDRQLAVRGAASTSGSTTWASPPTR